MLQDKLLEDELDFKAVDHEIETPVKNVDFKDASVLNPMSPAWTPRHSHTVPLATNHCTDMFISVNEQKNGDMFTTHTASTPFIGYNQFPEAKKVNDPIYGNEVMSDSKQVDKHPRDKRRGKSTLLGRAHANFTTSANETPSGLIVLSLHVTSHHHSRYYCHHSHLSLFQ
ncbi:hypothetical protein KUTeg_011132, partial [Tegillarca granosa]